MGMNRKHGSVSLLLGLSVFHFILQSVPLVEATLFLDEALQQSALLTFKSSTMW
jgi:hypothetical protein